MVDESNLPDLVSLVFLFVYFKFGASSNVLANSPVLPGISIQQDSSRVAVVVVTILRSHTMSLDFEAVE